MCGGKWSPVRRGEGNGETRSRFRHRSFASLFGCRTASCGSKDTSSWNNWHNWQTNGMNFLGDCLLA